MLKNIPDGWSYEGPDPTVGIFGEQWIHEDCTSLAGPGDGEMLGVDKTENQTSEIDAHGMAEVVHHLVCQDCAETATFATQEYFGVEESLDEVGSVG